MSVVDSEVVAVWIKVLQKSNVYILVARFVDGRIS